jgi:hypothetical protein
MDNKNLLKLSESAQWHEVLVLYSGLIDQQNKEVFIEGLQQNNPLLAAQCINSNWASEIKAESSLIAKSEVDLKYLYTDKSEKAIAAIYTLLELGKIDLLLPIIQNSSSDLIPIFKLLVPKIVELSSENLEYVVLFLLKKQPHIFLNQLFQILIQNSENKSILKTIYIETHTKKDVKMKHLFQFLKYFGISEKFTLSRELQEQYVKEAKNYNDLLFIQRSQSFDIKFKDIIQLVFNQPLTPTTALMILDIFNNNGILRTTLLDHYLSGLVASNKAQNQAQYIIICHYFNIKCKISAGRLEKQIRNKNILRTTVLNNSLFVMLYNKLIDELKKNKSERNAQNFVGRKEKVIVLSEYKYHYIATVNSIQIPILIPKSEIFHPLTKGKSYDVCLIYFDEKSKYLFGSAKQINKQRGNFQFNFENLKVAKEGDLLKAKIVKSDNRITIKVYEVGKKTKVKILNPNFDYQEYENMFTVRVDHVNNFNEISVFVLKPIIK